MSERAYEESTTLAEHRDHMEEAMRTLYGLVDEFADKYHLSGNDVTALLMNILLTKFSNVFMLAHDHARYEKTLEDLERILGIG